MHHTPGVQLLVVVKMSGQHKDLDKLSEPDGEVLAIGRPYKDPLFLSKKRVE
jgi:hypothetical protein